MDLREKIQDIEPEVIDKELIEDGLNSNYRPTKRIYKLKDGTNIEEVIIYSNAIDDPSWRAVKTTFLKEI